MPTPLAPAACGGSACAVGACVKRCAPSAEATDVVTIGGRALPFERTATEELGQNGGATTADALALIGLARRRVHEQFGVMLEPEVRLVGKISLPPFEADGQSG